MSPTETRLIEAHQLVAASGGLLTGMMVHRRLRRAELIVISADLEAARRIVDALIAPADLFNQAGQS